MANSRWIYSIDGTAAFYRLDENIYAPNGKREFWVSDTWWYSDGGDEFYESGNLIYSKSGEAKYFYG